jgi:hypothetical protein
LEQSKYIHEYVPADASVLYHEDDPALTKIRLSLPTPPALHLIAGYGLPAAEQRFKPDKYPEKLKRLEELSLQAVKDMAENDKAFTATLYKIQEKFWKELNDKREYYAEEIKFAKRTWWKIIHGAWYFIKGKPTYITGAHYFYLNFWMIDGQKLPDYRDRDRREFIFFEYCNTATETFAKLDKNGIAIPEPDGSYEMIDLGRRISYGCGQNKNRRSGNTNKGLVMLYRIAITHKGTDGVGIMSLSGESAEGHMKQKMLPAWRKMPLIIKPLTSSSNDPKSIVHKTPSSVIGVDSLENAITCAGTAEANFYDGKKLWGILVDESGKAKNLDVRERHSVLQHCLSQGNGSIIHGWEYQPSTAEDLSKGGKAYKGLLDDSFFYRRNELTGQTRSGLFRLFIPADEALDGYIDSYGFSVRGKKPTEWQKKEGFKTTATMVLTNEREQLLRDSKTNPEAMITYRGKKKQFPLFYDDSFIGGSGDIGFDMEILDKRLADLSRIEQPTQRGDFVWAGQPFRSAVVWHPDELKGKFYVSHLLNPNETNQKVRDTYYDQLTDTEVPTFRPKFPDKFTLGADPFNFKTASQALISNGKTSNSSGKGSDGGIAVFWHRDYSLDSEDTQISEWKSNRFICTYRYRESDNIKYAEDVLKCALYYGAMVFPEINIRVVWEKFIEWNYSGFLKYQVDSTTNKIKEFPGVQSLERSKQEGFSWLRDHIASHGHREMHSDLITEWKNINGLEEMTKYDLLAASMCAGLGSKSSYGKLLEEENEMDYDLSSYYNRR